MKRKLTKEQYEALEEGLKALYVAKGDGYALDLEDDDEDDDSAAELERLRSKRDIEVEHRKKAEKRVRDLEKQIDDDEKRRLDENDDDARKTKDIEALDKSWKAKYEKREQELLGEVGQSKAAVEHLLIDSNAQQIATRLSEVPELLSPVIKQRLRVEYVDGKPELRVLDSKGELSASSLEDLEKEIAGDKRYAPVIIASKGSGGGSRGNPKHTGGAKKFSELSEQERIDWHRDDPEGFKKASQEANSQ